MENLKKSLNEYIFLEFGMDVWEDEDEAKISEDWPFALREIGQIQERIVFEFDDDDEPYFAIANHCLDFFQKAGMTFEDLVLQYSGSVWLDAHNPVDISMSMPGDAYVPSGLERRKALQSLAADVLGVTEPEILQGLFLKTERSYLGLFRAPGNQTAVIGGLPDSTKLEVQFPHASSWRRLAWGIGVWLRNTRSP